MLSKKHISILFLFAFIFSNVGWSVNVHYCKDIVFSQLSYFQDSKHHCEMEKETTTMPCCQKTEQHQPDKKDNTNDCCKDQIIKSSASDQSVVIAKTLPFQFEALLADYSWTELYVDVTGTQSVQNKHLAYYIDSNAPPLFKLYCQFIFYA